MAFKLSNEALENILGERDYGLAYSEELNRLHLELENPAHNLGDTNVVRGEIKMLRKLIALHDKALHQMEAEYSKRRTSVKLK